MPFDEALHDVLQQQHQAAQYIALAGHYLIPRQPDDSNTNMKYLRSKKVLAGNKFINGSRLGLHLKNFELQLLDSAENPEISFSLIGLTWQQAFEKLSYDLSHAGFDVTNFSEQLHYEIPEHRINNGSPFSIANRNHLDEHATYRHNADIVFNTVLKNHKEASEIRIWPHHFDTGAIIPLHYNKNGAASKSLGLGWSIPDSMVSEPYYYLSIWSEKPGFQISTRPNLKFGEWINSGWNGMVLRNSDILVRSSSREQFDLVRNFYKDGIHFLENQLQ